MPHRYSKPSHRGDRWIKHALEHHEKGELHRQLGVPLDRAIPPRLLRAAVRRPQRFVSGEEEQRRLVRRARLAMTLAGFGKRRRRR